MATNGMEIKVGADVKGAVAGINQLNTSLRTLPNSASNAASSLSNFGSIVGTGALAFGALSTAMILMEPLQRQLTRQFKEAKENLINLVDANRKYRESLSDATEGTGKAVVRIFALVNALKSGKLSTDEVASAQKELVKANPDFADAFDKSKVNVDKLNKALDATVVKIFDTIKASAATKILSKEFEKIADQILQEGKNLTLLQTIFAGAGGKGVGGTSKKFAEANLNAANNALENFGKRVDEVFTKLKIGADITKPLTVKPETIKKIKDLNDEIIKIGLGEQTRFQRDIQFLEEKINKQEEFNKLANEALQNAPKRKPGDSLGGIINDPNADKSTLKILDPSALNDLQNVDKLNEKLLNTKDLINNGLNSGIDQFFNAIANNQDPFKALAQSAARLVTELAAAVVKALVLKAISTAISGGTDTGADKLIGQLTGAKGVVRGSDLTLLIGRGI